MSPISGRGSRAMLRRLRQVMAEHGGAQGRLDLITRVIATNMTAEVCSIYLLRDDKTLELCATEGLKGEAVGRARLKIGVGLVGRIAQRAEPFSTDDALNAPGFRYLPETGEEIYRSFVGVPIQRLGKMLGVLVVQNAAARVYTEDEIDALEITAMVIAEMAESGALTEARTLAPRRPVSYRGGAVGEGIAIGKAWLKTPKVAILSPIIDDIDAERERLFRAMGELREEVDDLLKHDLLSGGGEHREVLETYRMFAHDKGWARRLEEAVASGVAAEVAVERVQSAARARMDRSFDPYLRERLHDLDDLANRLLRRLTGVEASPPPPGAILIATSIGPAELLEVGARISGVVLEEGSANGHAAIVARALGLPMVASAHGVVAEAEAGDEIVVDGDDGGAYLRPEPAVVEFYREKVASAEEARRFYATLRDLPATTRDGETIALHINAGLPSDVERLDPSGAEGIGLYRTELMFMIQPSLPGREHQAAAYRKVLDAAGDRRVAFRTLDIGSDKVLPYMKRIEEENPAMGWRALRLGLDRPLLMRMQLQALLRGAGTRPLTVMFPFVSDAGEFRAAREMLMIERDRLAARGRAVPEGLEVGAMLETPALADAPDAFFREVDFISIGGNDLHQFFFAADRANTRLQGRYDTLSNSWLGFLSRLVARCVENGAPLSFCGESAGRPLEALALAAIGLRSLSMRPGAIGPVKRLLRLADLGEARERLAASRAAGEGSARARLAEWTRETVPL